MDPETESEVSRRAAVHRALGDEHRLAIVDALQLSDRSPTELREATGLASNLLAFHLDVLEEVGLIVRTRSQGDARRRYVTLRDSPARLVGARPRLDADLVAFVCTANSARSQLAARLWADRTGRPALSAGTEPAERVHPLAVKVATRHGLDLTDATPRHVDQLDQAPQLVVSVCDRAHESGLAPDAPQLHWSVADPAGGDLDGFELAFTELSLRVDRLAGAQDRAWPTEQGLTVTDTPTVLFLCVHNAGRSQMAAGWMRHLAGDRIQVLSGGSAPAEQVNPAAVEVMREVGIDITRQAPKPWTDETLQAADVVITMGCGDTCPVIPGKRYLDWELTDPAGKPIDQVRPIRDDIGQRVRQLMTELGVHTDQQ